MSAKNPIPQHKIIRTRSVTISDEDKELIEQMTGSLTDGIRLLPQTLKSLASLRGVKVEEIIRELKNK